MISERQQAIVSSIPNIGWDNLETLIWALLLAGVLPDDSSKYAKQKLSTKVIWC